MKKHRHIQKRKRVLAICAKIAVGITILLCFLSVLNRIAYKEIYTEIAQLSDDISLKNMNEINKKVFGTDEKFTGDGIISEVIPYSKIKTIYISDTHIVLAVRSPRIEKIEELLKLEEPEKIKVAISNNIDKYDKKTSIVTLSYIPLPDENVIDYQEYNFVNAITAGLLDEYKKLKKGTVYIDPQKYIEN